MNATVFLRIAAVILLLHFLGHTVGGVLSAALFALKLAELSCFLSHDGTKVSAASAPKNSNLAFNRPP